MKKLAAGRAVEPYIGQKEGFSAERAHHFGIRGGLDLRLAVALFLAVGTAEPDLADLVSH